MISKGGLAVEDDDFMCGVDIQTLSQRERDWIIIQCGVRSRVIDRNWGVGESCDHFLNVSNALGTSDGRPKGGVVPARISAQSGCILGRDLPEGEINAG